LIVGWKEKNSWQLQNYLMHFTPIASFIMTAVFLRPVRAMGRLPFQIALLVSFIGTEKKPVNKIEAVTFRKQLSVPIVPKRWCKLE
jgi:hypothetical protein